MFLTFPFLPIDISYPKSNTLLTLFSSRNARRGLRVVASKKETFSVLREIQKQF